MKDIVRGITERLQTILLNLLKCQHNTSRIPLGISKVHQNRDTFNCAMCKVIESRQCQSNYVLQDITNVSRSKIFIYLKRKEVDIEGNEQTP